MGSTATARVLLFMGEGKGKTTAALGMVLRAAGHGRSVRLAQFFKARPSGELAACGRLGGVEILRDGCGFVTGDEAPHREAAQRLWRLILDGERREAAYLLVLDEIALAAARGFVETGELLALLDRRPPGSATVMTGRNPPAELVARADTVTEMDCVKHGMRAGFPAQPGVEE